MSGRLVATLFVDGEDRGQVSGAAQTFTNVSVFLGQTGAAGTAPSDFTYDEVEVNRSGINELGNGGFESALGFRGTLGAPVPEHFGNWYCHDQNTGTDRQTTRVHTGSWAAACPAVNGETTYYMQDISLELGDLFNVEAMVYPAAGTQLLAVAFDWDRGITGSTAGGATIFISPTETTFGAGGASGTAPPLAYGQWNHVLLQLSTIRHRPTLGRIGFG